MGRTLGLCGSLQGVYRDYFEKYPFGWTGSFKMARGSGYRVQGIGLRVRITVKDLQVEGLGSRDLGFWMHCILLERKKGL